MYVYLYIIKCTHNIIAMSIGGCALWSCARTNMGHADAQRAETHRAKMHEAYSMHAAVERLFTNTGYNVFCFSN